MDTRQKLEVLADAAKYDASCASSGGKGRRAGPDGIGSTTGAGICHSYAPDGRCISLLKILLTNFCIYDCQYCVNRRSSDVRRARFSVDEVVRLTMDFYRRNYIEGLFLSSGIIRDADYTMEQLIAVARKLRVEERFSGYIHLKTIPEADERLIEQAGLWADRLSVNIELPSQQALSTLAPEKDERSIKRAMGVIRLRLEDEAPKASAGNPASEAAGAAPADATPFEPDGLDALPQRPPRDGRRRFAAAGQSTQLIVGADDSSDAQILTTSQTLYASYRLKRVYYSAFSPIPHASRALPSRAPPLMREHRLYQADWLLRYYGFEASELFDQRDAQLELDVDPKTAWALAHRDQFPVDLNRADRERLLRVPGIGVRNVERLLAIRRQRRIRYDDLARLRCRLASARAFVVVDGWRPDSVDVDSARLHRALANRRATQAQGSLF